MAFGFSCSWTGAMKKKIVISHRGASGYLPEHTLEAVAMAHAFNPDYIEPDLVLTKDNRVVVLHDIYLDYNTDVAEKFPSKKRKDGHWYVIDFTLKEIKTLKVHERSRNGKAIFPRRFPYKKSSFEVPSFEEYIELIQGLNQSRGMNIGIYPEIKSPFFHRKNGKDSLEIVMKVLRKYGYDKEGANIYLQCFDPDLLQDFKRRFPKSPIRLVQLIADDSWGESKYNYQEMRTKEGLKKISQYASGIGVWIPFILSSNKKTKGLEVSSLVKDAHREGLFVHAYTFRKDSLPKKINSAEKYYERLLNSAEVDGVFTDFSDFP